MDEKVDKKLASISFTYYGIINYKYYIKNNINKRKICYVPKEWAIPIIGEDEYNMLIELSGGAPGINPYQEEFEEGCKKEENKVKA